MNRSDVQLRYLDAMGIQAWVRRGPNRTGVETRDSPPLTVGPTITQTIEGVEMLGWEGLAERVRNCTACALHEQRSHSVFGVGNQDADWMIIGEAPGADEDRQGEPFVGKAGQLLNVMLGALGLQREQVYITNIVKCRPPGNRDPSLEEATTCEPYLRRQIALIQPKIIVAVGRIAAHNLLKTEARVGALRGQQFTYAKTGIPVVVTYHPAYLLRSPGEKRKAWQDLQFAARICGGMQA